MREVVTHTRRGASTKPAEDTGGEAQLLFDERVPVEVIELPAPETADLAEAEIERIGEKASYYLASCVILKHVRRVIKRRGDVALHCAPAPVGVLGTGRADASLLAGMAVDKLIYHPPLYRQHQRLAERGIDVSRA